MIQLKSVSHVDVVERIVLTDDQGNDIVQSSLKSESNRVFKSRLQIPTQVNLDNYHLYFGFSTQTKTKLQPLYKASLRNFSYVRWCLTGTSN